VNPAAPSDTTPPAEVNPTLGEWFRRNGTALVLAALVLLFLYAKFDVDGLWNLTKAALGLGLVIFIHELGHFAVAKWCDVHVETFSIGFGPALPGCKFKSGETTYMIALFPLGGYVKMVGEGSESEEGDDDPRSFKNKTVWQRMAIISAGVIMNVILAFICFIIVFRGPGKKQTAAVIGMVESASPAWVKGIPSGARIDQIGSEHDPFFTDILTTVMPSDAGEALELRYRSQFDSREHRLQIIPRKRPNDTRPMIGLSPAERLIMPPQRYYKERKHPVYYHSAAAQASPPFQFQDEIIGVALGDQRKQPWNDKWDPKTGGTLPDDWRNKEKKLPDYFVFARKLRQWAGQPITVRVKHKDGDQESILVPPAFHSTFGVRMEMGQVTGVRDGSPARKAGVQAATPEKQDNPHDGDIIEQVRVTDVDGTVIRFVFPRKGAVHPLPRGKNVRAIDPARLPFELRQWAARKKAGDRKVKLLVQRDITNKTGHPQREAVTLELEWDGSDQWKFTNEVPYALNSPMAIPELGLAYQVMSVVSGVDADWSARHRQPLKKGDVIKKIHFWMVNKEGEIEEGPGIDLKSEGSGGWKKFGSALYDQWAYVFWSLQHSVDIRKLTVVVDRDGEEKELVLKAQEDPSWPLAERGLLLTGDQRIQRADSIGGAVVLGLQDTYQKILQVYRTLRGIITSRISPKNLGGPITIARVAFSIAGENFWEFVYFLGLISINLAVVNFLPIPVLDGGHMVFLIYEKIRGKPASEQVRSGATIVGLLLLASLMIFVLYLDVSRIIGK
jgi:regulator of sigma E protease